MILGMLTSPGHGFIYFMKFTEPWKLSGLLAVRAIFTKLIQFSTLLLTTTLDTANDRENVAFNDMTN